MDSFTRKITKINLRWEFIGGPGTPRKYLLNHVGDGVYVASVRSSSSSSYEMAKLEARV